jgi:hypothetical protein
MFPDRKMLEFTKCDEWMRFLAKMRAIQQIEVDNQDIKAFTFYGKDVDNTDKSEI